MASDQLIPFIKNANKNLSMTSIYFQACYIINPAVMIIMWTGLLVYFHFDDELQCHISDDLRAKFEDHCWNTILPTNAWKLLPHAMAGHMLLLLVPFAMWRMVDRKYLPKVMKEIQRKQLVTFFRDTLDSHQWYIFSFHVIESLNTIILTCILLIINHMIGISLGDVYHWIADQNQQKETGHNKISILFPLKANCSMKILSMDPKSMDWVFSACSLKYNTIRRTAFLAAYIWTAILILGGILQTGKNVLLFCVRRLRILNLRRLAGSVAPINALQKLGYRLPYSDYIILVALSKFILPYQYNNFLSDLAEHLYSDNVIKSRMRVKKEDLVVLNKQEGPEISQDYWWDDNAHALNI